MNKIQLAALLAAAILSASGLTVISYSLYNIKEYKEIYIEVKVENSVGLNADTDSLKFGKIPPGGKGERTITLANNYDIPLRAYITVSGEVSRFIYLDENYFWLNPGESKELKIYANVDYGSSPGTYPGQMKILFKRK